MSITTSRPALLRPLTADPGTYPPVAPTAGAAAVPALARGDLTVPLVDGGSVEYADFDYAASTPALRAVRDAVEEALPYYGSVHRGAGYTSRVATSLYEESRAVVHAWSGARPDDTVVFTRNTTDSLNLLARCLPRRTAVVVFAGEHHANLLPWNGLVTRLPVPNSPQEAVTALDAALVRLPRGPKLVCVTAASNVTGEVWPVAALAAAAHRHGARIVVDAAQYAPHRPLDLAGWDADYLAFSGHKCYAPYGSGVLAGRPDWLEAAEPYLRGGGASERVTEAAVTWAALPDRQEAGTPNVLGAAALAAACRTLSGPGRADLVAHEGALLARLRAGLRAIPGVRELRTFGPDHPRVAITSFTVDGLPGGRLAAALSAEYGIGVRDGRFCAHLLVDELLARAGAAPAAAHAACGDVAVRASLGLGTTAAHVDRLVAAVGELAAHGPRWAYAEVHGRVEPTPDPRPLPSFLARPAVAATAPEGC